MTLDLSHIHSLGESIWEQTHTFAENTALIEANREQEKSRWAYRDFRQTTMSFCTALQYFGLFANKRVAVLMSNQPKWLMSATAVFWGGGVLVPLDYKLTPIEQLALLDHSQASFLIVEWPIWQMWIKEGIRPHSHVQVIVSEAPTHKFENESGVYSWETLADMDVPAEFLPAARTRNDLACIVYSSGTGGQPKGCMLTHGNYLAQLEAVSTLVPFYESDRYFSILPTNHAIDFMCGFIFPLHYGAAVVHQRTLRPEFLISTMQKYGITHMALVPMLLKAFEQKIREKISTLSPFKQNLLRGFVKLNAWATKQRPNYPVSSTLLKPIHAAFGGKLRLLVAGGAFVEPSTAEFFYNFGIPVAIGYGLTEAGTVLTMNTLDPFRSDTVGKAIPGTEIQIRNANPKGVGEVWVRGPTVMKGYLDNETLTRETIVNGWLATGDLGMLDSHGHLQLVGRSKNMIVTAGGKNVYPEDVETQFDALSEKLEHCILSSSYIWGETSLTQEGLVLVVRPVKGASTQAFLEKVKEKNRSLADYKRISKVLFVDEEFPRTASMKLKREALAQHLKKVPSPNLIEVQS